MRRLSRKKSAPSDDPLAIENVIEPVRRKRSPTFLEHLPEIALEWCYAQNCGWGPEDFTYGSKVKAWWTCPQCHNNFRQSIKMRSRGEGCPFCASKRVCAENSFVLLYPVIAAEWHPKKNGKRKPAEFTYRSNHAAWWQCPKHLDHVWQISIGARTTSESDVLGCPYCLGRQVSATNSLANTNPELSKQWHPTKNKDLKQDQVTAGTNQKYWWLCEKGHSWRTSPNERKNKGCPFCAGKRVAVNNSLEAVHPKYAKMWHKTLNGRMKPKHFCPTSSKMAWWQCPENESHCFQATIAQIVTKNRVCPDCKELRAKELSFAKIYPELATTWHPTKNGNLTANDIAQTSHKEVWWYCPKAPDHEWYQTPADRIKTSRCPFCRGGKVSASNSLATKFPEIAKEFHPSKNGNLTPETITAFSSRMIWWQCSKNPSHEFERKPLHRTRRKRSCPFCMVG